MAHTREITKWHVQKGGEGYSRAHRISAEVRDGQEEFRSALQGGLKRRRLAPRRAVGNSTPRIKRPGDSPDVGCQAETRVPSRRADVPSDPEAARRASDYTVNQEIRAFASLEWGNKDVTFSISCCGSNGFRSASCAPTRSSSSTSSGWAVTIRIFVRATFR
jgi:hypothetical protein